MQKHKVIPVLKVARECYPEAYRRWLGDLRERVYELRDGFDHKVKVFNRDQTRFTLIWWRHVQRVYAVHLYEKHDGDWDPMYGCDCSALTGVLLYADYYGYPLGELSLP